MDNSERILRCCHNYPSERLDVETIAVLTKLPEDVVSKSLDELKKAQRLPKQYLTHLLN